MNLTPGSAFCFFGTAGTAPMTDTAPIPAGVSAVHAPIIFTHIPTQLYFIGALPTHPLPPERNAHFAPGQWTVYVVRKELQPTNNLCFGEYKLLNAIERNYSPDVSTSLSYVYN